jgi:hypothetical protein
MLRIEEPAMDRTRLAAGAAVKEQRRDAVGVPALLEMDRVQAADPEAALRERLERRIQRARLGRGGGTRHQGRFNPLKTFPTPGPADS